MPLTSKRGTITVRTPITIDDKFTFSYGSSWAYTLLEDTSDHTTGYTKS